MSKDTTRNTSTGLPPQRSLRSRKRECPDDSIVQPKIDLPKFPPKDSEINGATPATSSPHPPQSALQESAKVLTLREAAEEALYSTRGGNAAERLTSKSICVLPPQEAAVEKTAGRPETAPPNSNKDCELSNVGVVISADYSKVNGGKEKVIKKEESIKSPSRVPTEQPQPSLPPWLEADNDDGGCMASCETGEHVEINIQSNKQGSNPMCGANDNYGEIKDKELMGLPSKKRRRMGMCVLSEKERCHVLQTRKHGSGKDETKGDELKVEDAVCDEECTSLLNINNTCESDEPNLVAKEDILASMSFSSLPPSSPVSILTEQIETEIIVRSLNCVEIHSAGAETDTHTTSISSEGACNVWNPDQESSWPAKKGESNHAAVVKKQDDPKKDPDIGSVELHHCPVAVFTTTISQGILTENDHREREQDAPQQMDSLATTGEETLMILVENAEPSVKPESLSTGAGPGRSDSVEDELGDAAAAPCGPEDNGNCGLDGAQHPQTMVTPDPFDCMSDSQLCNMALIEEQVMEEGGGLSLSHGHEEATDLVCGLIKELSSLNRIVMATQRELDNFHRANKGPKTPKGPHTSRGWNRALPL